MKSLSYSLLSIIRSFLVMAKKIGPKKGIILQMDDVTKSQNSLKMLGLPDVPRQIKLTITFNFQLYLFESYMIIYLLLFQLLQIVTSSTSYAYKLYTKNKTM